MKLNRGIFMSIAGSLGIGIGCMVLLIDSQRKESIGKLAITKAALQMIDNQKAVLELLGGSYVVGRVSFSDGWTRIDKEGAKIRLPINGTSDKAILFIYGRRVGDDKHLELYRLEMMFSRIKEKKLVLLETEDDSSLQARVASDQRVE